MIESCMPLVWTMRVIHLLPAGLRSGTCWGDGRVSAVMGFVGDVSELISFGYLSEVDVVVEYGTKVAGTGDISKERWMFGDTRSQPSQCCTAAKAFWQQAIRFPDCPPTPLDKPVQTLHIATKERSSRL